MSIFDAFKSAFRDFNTDGLPSTGKRDVWKAEARALGGAIDQTINTLFALFVFGGAKAYTTKAAMTADYASRPADSFAVVYADSTAANNDVYIRGASAWVSLGLTLTAAALAQLADHTTRLVSLEGIRDDLIQRRIPFLASVAGGDTITAVTTPLIATKSNFQAFWLEPVAANTTAVTVNIDAAGAVPLLSTTGAALVAGDLVIGRTYLIMRRASGSYRIVSPFLGSDTPKSLAAAITALSGGAVAPRETLKKVSDALDAINVSLGNSIAGEAGARAAGDVALQTALGDAALSFVQTQQRPGDSPGRYTSSLTGSASAAASPPGTLALVGMRRTRRLVGPQTLAIKERIAIEMGAAYQVFFAAQRSTNPSDPSGGTVRFGIRWLDASFATVGSDYIEDRTLRVADGRISRALAVAGAAGTGVDVVWPAGAAYMVIYVKTYDADGATDVDRLGWLDGGTIAAVGAAVEFLTGQVTDLTDLVGTKANATELIAKADKATAITATGAAAGGGTLANPITIDVPFASTAEAKALVNAIKVMTPATTAASLADRPRARRRLSGLWDAFLRTADDVVIAASRQRRDVRIAGMSLPVARRRLSALYTATFTDSTGAIVAAFPPPQDRHATSVTVYIATRASDGYTYPCLDVVGVPPVALADPKPAGYYRTAERYQRYVWWLFSEIGAAKQRADYDMNGTTSWASTVTAVLFFLSLSQSTELGILDAVALTTTCPMPGRITNGPNGPRTIGSNNGTFVDTYLTPDDIAFIQDGSEEPDSTAGETPATRRAQMLLSGAYAWASNVAAHNALNGISGAPVEELFEGQPPFENTMVGLRRCAIIAALTGRPLIVPAMNFRQGQSNATDSKAKRRADLLALWESVNRRVHDVLPEMAAAVKVVLILPQYASWTMYGLAYAEMAEAPLELATEYPDRFFVSQNECWLETRPEDGIHYLSAECIKMGELDGVAWKYQFNGPGWPQLKFLNNAPLTTSGGVTKVVAKVTGLLGAQILARTDIISDPGAYGAKFVYSGGTAGVSATSAAVTGVDEVTFTLSGNPGAATNMRMRVSLDGTIGAHSGPSTGPRTPLCDSIALLSTDGVTPLPRVMLQNSFSVVAV